MGWWPLVIALSGVACGNDPGDRPQGPTVGASTCDDWCEQYREAECGFFTEEECLDQCEGLYERAEATGCEAEYQVLLDCLAVADMPCNGGSCSAEEDSYYACDQGE